LAATAATLWPLLFRRYRSNSGPRTTKIPNSLMARVFHSPNYLGEYEATHSGHDLLPVAVFLRALALGSGRRILRPARLITDGL
jgi:hypothetical protein